MKFASLSLGLILAGTTVALAQPPATPPAPITADSKAPVVHGKDVSKMPVAFYTENGKPVVARGPDAAKAPKDAVVIQVEAIPLGGGAAFRRITIQKGQSFTAPKGADTIVYVVKGKLGLKLGTVSAEVGVGDAWRKIAAQDNVYTAIDEAVIVETEAPKS